MCPVLLRWHTYYGDDQHHFNKTWGPHCRREFRFVTKNPWLGRPLATEGIYYDCKAKEPTTLRAFLFLVTDKCYTQPQSEKLCYAMTGKECRNVGLLQVLRIWESWVFWPKQDIYINPSRIIREEGRERMGDLEDREKCHLLATTQLGQSWTHICGWLQYTYTRQ